MYRKSFASLSISPHKLKVVKLSRDKKRCIVAASIDVPEGLIVSGKLTDRKALTTLIKNLWKSNSVNEKTVGLILPEVTTFMKSFQVPMVSLDELDEAVRWQVAEFLPTSHEDMVLDWKIVAKTDKSYEVLSLAISKSSLSDYVGSVVDAGLLPLLVETTSVSLERIAESADVSKVVLYRSRGVAVVVTIASKKVLSSSVVYEPTDEQLINNVFQIISRSSSNPISRVAVCGNGLTQDFVNNLHSRIGVPVDLLHPKKEGLPDEKLQEYIIALSQQEADPEEPLSKYSINLLPPEWVTRYRKEIRDLRLWTATLIGSIVFWPCFLLMLGTYVFLSQRSAQLDAESKETSQIDLNTVSSEINKINAEVAKANQAVSSLRSPSEYVNKATAKLVSGVSIASINLNLESKKMKITGVAASRGELLSFKQSLEEEKTFLKVNLPIASLLIETNIPFEIEIDIKI